MRKKRLVPTGDCFCGCGGEAGIGRWFVLGHDITAAGALRAVEGGLSLPQRLVEAGFGPERSVVQEAVTSAGWVRCAGCAYAGSPAGLAAHVRGGGCDGAGQAQREPAQEPSEDEEPPAEPRAGGEEQLAAQEPSVKEAPGGRRRRAAGRTGGEDRGLVRAQAGPACGLLLPGPGDGVWRGVPLHLRQNLSVAAHQLVTPEQAVLREKENRGVRYALRAAGSNRLTGKHWLALLTSPRESFGSARSERADRVFALLEQVVAEYVRPAVGDAGAEGATHADAAAQEAVEAAAGHAAPPQEAAPAEAEPAPPVKAETGAARGRLLPGKDDLSWGEVPLHLR